MKNKCSCLSFVVAVAGVFLSGCATNDAAVREAGEIVAPSPNVPVSTNFPTSAQLRLQAVKHWATIADDTAMSVVSMLSKGGICIPATHTCALIYVNPPVVVTEFSRVFHTQLITTMVKAGLNVSKEPSGTVMIDVDVQPVAFSQNGPQYQHAGVAGDLGRGIVGLREAKPASSASSNSAGEGAMDWLKNKVFASTPPLAEIVVTVSASDKARYLARETNVYYITEGETGLYNQEICSVFSLCSRPVVAVVEKKPVCPECQPKPLREFKIEGDCPLDKMDCPVIKRSSDLQPSKKSAKKTK